MNDYTPFIRLFLKKGMCFDTQAVHTIKHDNSVPFGAHHINNCFKS